MCRVAYQFTQFLNVIVVWNKGPDPTHTNTPSCYINNFPNLIPANFVFLKDSKTISNQ